MYGEKGLKICRFSGMIEEEIRAGPGPGMRRPTSGEVPREMRNTMSFQIVSDSSCDLGRERAQELGVSLVSYYAALGDEHYYREEQDITAVEFYRMMASMPGVFPKTSMPSMEDYLEVFRPIAASGSPLLCICLNARFSASYQSACNAAALLKEEVPGLRIRVVDSQFATVMEGLMVEEAAVLRDLDWDLDRAADALEGIRPTGRIFFTTNDLEYLRHGGRIGKAEAKLGSLLKVKPLIGMYDAELHNTGIAQGRKNSLRKVRDQFLQYMEKNRPDLSEWRVATGCGLDREEYEAFTDEIYEGLARLGYQVPRSRYYQIGVTIGVHTGPTPVGVGIVRRVIPCRP